MREQVYGTMEIIQRGMVMQGVCCMVISGENKFPGLEGAQ